MLPEIIHHDGAGKLQLSQFGGINHRLAAANGDIWDDENVVADEYPMLMSRPDDNVGTTVGIYGVSNEGLAAIQLSASYIRLTPGRDIPCTFDAVQTITPFGNFYVIMPKKVWVRSDIAGFFTSLPQTAPTGAKCCIYDVGTYPNTWKCYQYDGSAWQEIGYVFGTMEETVHGSFTIVDGTIAGVAATANTIHASTGDFRTHFSAGDSLTLSGTAFPTTRTLVVREVAQYDLRFDVNSFTAEKTSTAKEAYIQRLMPDMDYVFAHENRLWGCKNQTIYASKLGDFRNWNNFDGISTDSYSVDIAENGFFTGGISYLGFPMFFKRDRIIKVYGSRPSNYETKVYAQAGCIKGNTLAVVNEALYYLSSEGVMRYSGGSPQLVSEALHHGGAYDSYASVYDFVGACAEKNKYLIWKRNASAYFEYDARTGIWHKQVIRDSTWTGNISFGIRDSEGMAYLVSTTGKMWNKAYGSQSENNIPFFVEFARFDFSTFASKYPVRLWLRYESSYTVTLGISYDGGAWETAATLPGTDLGTKYVPVPINRCDSFRLKISGAGDFRLYAMQIEVRAEQTNRKGG